VPPLHAASSCGGEPPLHGALTLAPPAIKDISGPVLHHSQKSLFFLSGKRHSLKVFLPRLCGAPFTGRRNKGFLR